MGRLDPPYWEERQDSATELKQTTGMFPSPFAWSGSGPANNGRTDNALRVKELLTEFGFGCDHTRDSPDKGSDAERLVDSQPQLIADRLDYLESGQVQPVSGRETIARIRAKIAGFAWPET